MPANYHWGAADDFVGDARVVWVKSKTHGQQIGTEFLVEQKGTFKHAIECFLKLNLESCAARFVNGDKFLIE